MKKAFLEAGEFVTTHGVAGELRLYPWCDEPAFLAGFTTLYLDESGRQPLRVARIRPHKSLCIVQLEGVESIEAARPYIGKTVYIARADAPLPKGSHFVQDLLGAVVRDADTGRDYGTIRAITHPGRHDVYEVARPDGGISLFPAAPPFVERVDADGGLVLIRPIPGMFNEGEGGA
jgi:16S rRNA processing protein RimM